MSALMDIWHAIQTIATSADYWTLGAAILIVIIAGFIMEGLSSLITVTLMSLLAFVLVKFALAMTMGGQHDPGVLAQSFWQGFVDFKMLTLLAYFILFGVLITVVNLIRSAIR